VFRDESMHMDFAFNVVRTVRAEEPDLINDTFEAGVREMLATPSPPRPPSPKTCSTAATSDRLIRNHVGDRKVFNPAQHLRRPDWVKLG
jgi:hypothetical protein